MEVNPFRFYKCLHLVRSTGKRASNLKEFLQIISQVEEESIFYHLHQAFRKYSFTVPEFPGDFATWAGEYLRDRALAEKLANIDFYSFSDIGTLRQEIVRIIEEHLKEMPGEGCVLPGEEFYFNKAISVIFPTPYEATDLKQFARILREVETNSIYYHFFEAKLRLGMGNDDFSEWIGTSLEKQEIAERIRKIDPYQLSLEEIRQKVLESLGDEDE